jgi:hypothetical protein
VNQAGLLTTFSGQINLSCSGLRLRISIRGSDGDFVDLAIRDKAPESPIRNIMGQHMA